MMFPFPVLKQQISMSFRLTTFSFITVIILFFSYFYKKPNDSIEVKINTTLLNLLRLEKSVEIDKNARIAIGYGACLDYIVPSKDLLVRYKPPSDGQYHSEITNEKEFLEVFAYYFSNGAATERYLKNDSIFSLLVKQSENGEIVQTIGGNAPIIALRLAKEGIKNILLGAQMSSGLKALLPKNIRIVGPKSENDDIHLLLEYAIGEQWGPFVAPRANRFIVHRDTNNPLIKSMELFHNEIISFDPSLIVVGGLQMMENFSDKKQRRERLLKMSSFFSKINKTLHFEMASFTEEELLRDITRYIIPHADSLGMNEQELPNLYQMLAYGNLSLASDPYPRVAKVLDIMRDLFNSLEAISTKISRIHVHTLAFQAMMVKKNWKNTRIAAAKAALTSHRHTCGSYEIDISKAKLILDDSFTTTRVKEKKKRIIFDVNNPVACWYEKNSIEICVAPVLVCTNIIQTGGGGDNVSGAGLVIQV